MRTLPTLIAVAAIGLAFCILAASLPAQDQHWSRQFKKPANSASMLPGTGMSDGTNKPGIRRAKWHDDRLWIAGAWETGVSAETGRPLRNEYWYLWTYSEQSGWEAICWYHSAQGGRGPDGVINDFVFLPDGRLVVVGEFTRIDNPGGTRYHRVNAVAVFDPNEPSANKWRPLGSFQYNGAVSSGGAVYCVAYDPQGNDLYLGGTFGGIRSVASSFVHRFDLDTNTPEPMIPGVGAPRVVVHCLAVDTRTSPSTIYVGGSYQYTGGEDRASPMVSASKNRWSTGLAAWRQGNGWTTFPRETPSERLNHRQDGPLRRAGDFKYYDSVTVLDILLDGDDIWIAGAFSEGADTGETLRAVARWDATRQVWTDPTGKGGFGREVYNMAKAENGKIYFAGAFGGRRGVDEFFDGFKDGAPAAMIASFDPATGAWEQLGSGLSSQVFPEARMAVNGNDVWIVGDFKHIGPRHFEGNRTAKPEFESYYIARWNETRDFLANPPQVGSANVRTFGLTLETAPIAAGSEHWSREFPRPPRGTPGRSNQSGATGMDAGVGTPDPSSITRHGETLYFTGNWEVAPSERWYVWSFHKEHGWKRLAWEGRGGQGEGPQSPPEGGKWHEGRYYVFGAISSHQGVAIFNPEDNSWSRLQGTYRGQVVYGNAMTSGAGPVNDIAWDSRTGCMWLVGSSGLENPDFEHPKDTAPVIRIDKDGNYHPMGRGLGAEDPNRPILGVYAIVMDYNQEQTGVYIGGTFNYYGGVPTTNGRMLFNVARWDYEALDWRPVGKGVFRTLSPNDRGAYPDGLPGLPARPDEYQGYIAAGFPRARALAVDRAGNLYAGGTLAVLDDNVIVNKRRESFGIAKYDKASDTWGMCANVGGVSRDINQMTWISETELLISGSFDYCNHWTPLNGVAVLDTSTGYLRPLGGGLMRASRDQTIGMQVRHVVDGDDWYFTGFFDHAGINANSRIEGPVESAFIARYNRTQNLDPNRGLSVQPIEPVQAPAGHSSVQVNVELKASAEGGTITWYERRADGSFNRRGQGESLRVGIRVSAASTDVYYYVTVTRDGVEGGKMPVRIEVRPPG